MNGSLGSGASLRRIAAALGAASILFLCLGHPPARAATWVERQVGEAQLFGMSCPTASECVAGGTGSTVITSRNPSGGAGDWSLIDLGGAPIPAGVATTPYSQIHSIDCPSPSLCVAVSLEGFLYTSHDPTGGAGAWTATDLSPSGPNVHLYGVSCPTETLCVAVASKGKVVASTDPAAGAGAWTVTQLPESLELRGVSCPSAALCVAVGLEGAVLSSTHPLGGAGDWSQTQLAGAPIDRGLLAVSCATASLCVTGNSAGTLYTATAPTGDAGSWAPAQGGGTVQITDLDCLPEGKCVAIDNNGDVLTSTDPSGGASAWTFQNLLPFVDEEDGLLVGNGIFGVSCASDSLCAVGGAKGRIFTSINPFEPPPPAPAGKGGANKPRRHKGPKRPRAAIGAQPPIGTEIRGSRTKVRFRFFAAGHVSVRGFVCKLDHRPTRPCRSPKSYRVGIGIHVFKVWAVGWTGHRGPPALGRFKICHPTKIGGFCVGAFPGGHR